MAKKEGIRKLFDKIAPDYDRLNHLLSLDIDKAWRKKAVKEIADMQKPAEILDVACGTGDFTIEIARKTAAGSNITGIDISEGMMEIGRAKIAESGVGKNRNVTMVQGDCEALPYTDNTFDRVSAGFGVRNFEHLSLGLSEMYRVLKNEGKVIILELSVPSNPMVRALYKVYFLKVLPAIGGWISGERGAYEYLPASVLRFPAPDKFIKMMEEAGFTKVVHRSMTFGICRMYTGTKEC
ncbi:MAG: bifunctional demethylmenaquinone methyltransferase/2-methoxy-6-polyprenyl-1,4-benzoquinol methylase UbiE [Bacteroidales bacterium]|nr:bifunctional demethylmenaquinone methyltransferase/2-methoxy-6-polyprenyl-1,4-benzoquinol methylase UbiE [Bacteroidales bacterium]MDE6146692.1 bifunctional demethylmenaquinone methyltransferase/2-methoxy-6-polyprenyl-1,4-benzoquinol methylase UbiE [Bacteroidales bacterium]